MDWNYFLGGSKIVSQEKWDKGRVIVSALGALIFAHESSRPQLNRKELERKTGFLNQLSMTFDNTTPFLKGFSFTLNLWFPQRDDQDWKVPDIKSCVRFLVLRLEKGEMTEDKFDEAVQE